MRKALLVVLLVAVALGAAILRRATRPEEPPPPPPNPSPGLPLPPSPAPGPRFEVLCRRSRDELLLFARHREFGRPLASIEVRVRAADGSVLRTDRARGLGVLRLALPGGAASVVVAGDGIEVAADLPPAPPPAPPAPLPILCDRSSVRPGDPVRFVVRALGAPDAVLSFEPEDAAIEPARFSREEELQAGFPGPVPHWIVLETRIPDDVRPGTAVATIGGRRLEIPVLPRFGSAAPPQPADRPRAPAAEAPAGDLRLSREDGVWRVECAEEIDSALFYATRGDRFLTHVATAAEGREARMAIEADPRGSAEVRMHAIVSTARGFLEASVPVPDGGASSRVLRIEPLRDEPRAGAPGARDVVEAWVEEGGERVAAAVAMAVEGEDDAGLASEEGAVSIEIPSRGSRRVRALAIPADGGPPIHARASVLDAEAEQKSPSRPPWVYVGDESAGSPAPPPARPFLLPVGCSLRPGRPALFEEAGIPIPGDVLVHYTIGTVKEATPVRVRAAEGILLEAFAAEDEPVMGEFFASEVAGKALLLETRAGADAALVIDLYAEVPVRPADVAESSDAVSGVAVSREAPGRVPAGSTAEVRIRVSSPVAVEAPCAVRCELPAGCVLAEDGWSMRSRAPEGTRVEASGSRVEWRLPRLGAATGLSLRARFPWKGRFAFPPTRVSGGGPASSISARSAGAVVVVE